MVGLAHSRTELYQRALTDPVRAGRSRWPDRARMPVTMPRLSDGKMRHDGSGAANVQPEHPVDERGGVHGASELERSERQRVEENSVVCYRSHKEKRRWPKDQQKHDRLGGLDKSTRCAPLFGRVFSWAYDAFARGAPDRRSLRVRHYLNDFRGSARCAGPQT